MIKKFFQSLNSAKVSYLLISGQATVLYGASTFSEDIDLWISPEKENWTLFLKVLKKSGALIYKLTPVISVKNILKGHGFHFYIPVKDKILMPCFLDVMGVVPRCGEFHKCAKIVNYYSTEWGKLPVMGIRDLVEIKKTRRIEDYAIISNLARIEYERMINSGINANDWEWILNNSFNAEDVLFYLENYEEARKSAKIIGKDYLLECLKYIGNDSKREDIIESLSRKLSLEVEEIRSLDRRYWRSVIDELKKMNNENKLLPVDSIPSTVVLE